MIRAGALFVAITIAFVIGLLSTFLILLAYHYRIQTRENTILKKLEMNAVSSINLLMSGYDLSSKETKTIDLYGEESDSVSIERKPWGAYEVATVKAFSGKYSLTKTIEYGYASGEADKLALYVSDLNRPVSFNGRTKVTGTVWAPQAGVKRGNLEGRGFEGKDLVNGTIKTSKNTLPSLNKELLKQLAEYIQKNDFPSDQFRIVNGTEKDTVIISFRDTTVVVRLGSTAVLNGKLFSGNVLVYADSTITIEREAQLQNVLIFARRIVIRRGFEGSIQAFAKDSILVEEDVKLNYPSVLGVFKADYRTKQPYIKIKKDAIVQGLVFTSQSEFVSDMVQTRILLEKDAVVHGQVYSDGFAEIKGEIRGSLYCNKLQTKGNDNHIMDATIDYTKLSPHYVGSALLSSTKGKRIIKWLE